MITPTPDDDPEFVGIASRILSSSIGLREPAEIYVLHVDNWFDRKWLNFSGTTLHVVGIWNTDVTIPPFRPNRILSQAHFVLDPTLDEYVSAPAPALHRDQASCQNLSRFLRTLSDSALFFWYSGASAQNRRGAFMLYHIAGEKISSWYAAYHRAPDWKALHALQISKSELAHLEQRHLTNRSSQPLTGA